MSDQSDVPAIEPDEAAQDAAAQEPASEHPWGDDFDAQRAWDTITKLRGFEKQAKEFERIQSDEEARAEWLKSQGYEITDDDEEADDPDEEDFEFEDDERPTEVRDPRVDDLLAERAQTQIRTDLDRFNAESGWELDDDDRRAIEVRARLQGGDKGFGPKELEAAHKWFIDRLERAASAGVERAKKPKPKAPHVTRGGKAATETPGWNDMTWEQQAEEMARRVQANAQ